ncbi:TetR/AcrR family transcriptional regulator [Curvibacter delicatus]|uniref:TetR/AcrR family transcriptional regulator n=1 Tax=Curvibacter delicatus TaxID=80879 RepID=UPI000A7FB51B|nr:TetR/AcrR family transcriptional regulator [Curvibacter delicatus]
MATSIRKNPVKVPAPPAPRRRLSPAERERQIVEGSVRFFSEHGLDGQLRDLARELGITHTLLYHYFPTKQALIERVYADLFAARWDEEWERLLDDKTLEVEVKLTRFYTKYAKRILERDWVRVFVFSGLSDRYITDRYFALLGEKLFPRLVRESRRYLGVPNRSKPTPREMELLMGLHGSIFYMGLRRWVYGLEQPGSKTDPFDEVFVHDRVRGYLQTLPEVFGHGAKPRAAGRTPRRALA